MTGEAQETVHDAAVRVLGAALPPEIANSDDSVVRRYVIGEMLGDAANRSDSYVQAAFGILAAGDPRMAQARRNLRRQAAVELARMQPAGSC